MSRVVKTAIIDLYNNEENQGMRCIKDILNETDCRFQDVDLQYDVFDARYKNEMATIDYDIFISSGGPGSPFEGLGEQWETKYFDLLDKIWENNKNPENSKKYIFFICHSFQLMARYFNFGKVTARNSKSFGVTQIHKTKAGEKEFILKNLPDPFYAADFRDWQVIRPNWKIIQELGAEILCLEKERPHLPYERAMMAVRISDEIIGTQFHPEADPASMYHHFRKPERKEQVVSKYGIEKYDEMLRLLEEPEAIPLTRKNVIPNFLYNAIKKLSLDKVTI